MMFHSSRGVHPSSSRVLSWWWLLQSKLLRSSCRVRRCLQSLKYSQWTISIHTVLYIICNTNIIGEITKMKPLMKSDGTVNACSGGVLDGSSLIRGLDVVDILDVYCTGSPERLHFATGWCRCSKGPQTFRVTHWVRSDAIDIKWCIKLVPICTSCKWYPFTGCRPFF